MAMELGLSGKVAIVTGGSKGIGRATALALLREGAKVVVCARGMEALNETVALAGARAPEQVEAVSADLTGAAAVRDVVSRCVTRFGAIDILINNAGSARTGEFSALADQAWLDDWTLKFFGYMRMAREALAHMSGRAGAVIINVIGSAALRPSAGYMIGGAINAALTNFTKSLAGEGARHGVRVVGINPGPILTERLLKMRPGGLDDDAMKRMTPLGRPGKPEEVADLALFLASERAAFIHGANITIDRARIRG